VSRAQCYLGLAKGALLLLWQGLQTAAGRNGVQAATIEVTREGQRPRRLTLGLSVAVLSRRPPGHHPFEGLDLEALAGEVPRPDHVRPCQCKTRRVSEPKQKAPS